MKTKLQKTILITILISLFLITTLSVNATETVIVNSKEWKDVYAGMQYGFLTDTVPKYLVSEKHATLILSEVNKKNPVKAYTSKDKPFVIGYESILGSKGFNASEIEFQDLSLELAERLEDINNYIIVDDSYGYNALAVAPYAIVSESYVLFTDSKNIRRVKRFLDSKDNLGDILIYGSVDREVREELEEYNPETINKDGDRFENNIEIVKKYKQIEDKKQVVLTNGEFIEASIMAGTEPVLFIGKENVPDKIKDYIINSNIEVGVLVGNDLVGTATTVKRQCGITAIVKFARSARNPSGGISQVEGLDIFAVPKVVLDLGIQSVVYNKLTRQVEITMRNNADVVTYFKGTYTIKSGDQEQTFGDLEPVFIEANSDKTIVYDIEPIIEENEIKLDAYIIFGESKYSLEKVIEQQYEVDIVEISDDSEIMVEKVEYIKNKGEFYVHIKNIGTKEVFVDSEVIDLYILDERQTFGSDETISIEPEKTKISKIILEEPLSDEELLDNSEIKIRNYYGERANALVKILEGDYALVVKNIVFGSNVITYIPLLFIIILLLLIIFGKRRKKKDKK